jgi:hypothetical protein
LADGPTIAQASSLPGMTEPSSIRSRGLSLAIGACLLAVGLFAAWPFFNRGMVGTGEAYNYSLSVADAVSQMRGGVIPPLAGQTEYAFNGRIHPLRNAPYLYYLCAGVDLATFHRLTFWQIQNVSLVLSLFGALFACYGGLRWATGCPRSLAAFLSVVYTLAPPLMGAAHTFDLFMTVHAAVFVPLAMAACVRGCRSPSFSNDAWLAAALAAAWLTHPPVAFWLTSGVILVRLVALAGNPSFHALARGLAAGVLGVLLSGFVFASAATLSPDLGYFSDEPLVWSHFPDTILKSLSGAFPGMLLPVSAGAGSLSDLQMGYVALGLVGLSLFLSLMRPTEGDPGGTIRFAALGCSIAAIVLVIMDLPIPFITLWAWQRVPVGAFKLTTEWPMQRLYLVAVGLTVFAAGSILPRQWRVLKAPRWVAPIAMMLAVAWVLFQAKPFIARGIANRWTPETTQSAFRPSNLDLTITSYAFVGPPPTYVHGVMDPRFEFRILRNGVDEIASPLATGLASSPIVQSGALQLSEGLAPGKQVVTPRLKLAPGRRYLLSFAFRTPPVQALLYLKGPLLDRTYSLPEAGEAKGFGMMDGERRSIPIWTDSDKTEEVEVRVWRTDKAVTVGKPPVFADFTLQEVDMDALPVRLDSLLPLRFTVEAPQGGCTVETPRRFLPGFTATVNGKPADVLISPYRQAMIPLPPGRSVVEMSYPGPWAARLAFWISVSCWVGFVIWKAAESPVPSRPWALVFVPASWAWRQRWAVSAVVIVGALAMHELRKRSLREAMVNAVGPVRIDFFLPYGRKNMTEPLLATGKVGAGVVVFVHYIDETHISLGADVWGGLFESGPIEADYSRLQTLVVSDGALFPKDNPRMNELDPTEADRLRSELRVELNGKVEIHATADTYTSTPSEVLVGRTSFGSLTAPAFFGRIVEVARMPIPEILMLPASMHARLDVRFPTGREGIREPILDVSAGPNSCLLSVAYGAPGNATLSLEGRDGNALQSAKVRFDPAQRHAIDVRPSQGETGIPPLTLSCSLDGTQVLGTSDSEPSGNVPIMHSGVNGEHDSAVLARFTGPELRMIAVPDTESVPQGQTWGMDVLILTFPLNKVGRQEPLLTSGVTGAGDFIYVLYQDEHHVKIGFDHWNGIAVISEPIAVDYQAPHEIWISSGPLYPDISPDGSLQRIGATDLERLRSGVRVALDGKTIIRSATAAYPSSPSQVTICSNRIGGSSADSTFSGIVHFSGRMDPRAVSW